MPTRTIIPLWFCFSSFFPLLRCLDLEFVLVCNQWQKNSQVGWLSTMGHYRLSGPLKQQFTTKYDLLCWFVCATAELFGCKVLESCPFVFNRAAVALNWEVFLRFSPWWLLAFNADFTFFLYGSSHAWQDKSSQALSDPQMSTEDSI